MVAGAARCDPGSVRRRLLGCRGQTTVEWLAGAKTPDDVIRAFLNQSQGSGERLLERLAFFAADTRAARHELGLDDPNAPLPLGLTDRPVGC